jgi:hypothetical protein
VTRAAVFLVTLALSIALVLAPSAAAAETGWHSDQPAAAGIGVPAPFGEIGDMAFWAPNRGVLITAGNEALPAGVYAYDGTGWHLYSTVCGGREGRIAWAGPDEFWTVSDYATAQEGEGGRDEGSGRTLCRFAGGQVVASYAEPLNSADVYQRMRAATCASPTDCWFAGEPLEAAAANAGAFHLNWNGSALTAVPSETVAEPAIEEPAGAIVDLAAFAGRIYESASEAPYIREIVAAADPFQPVALPTGSESVGPFRLSTDGGQLWAVAATGEVTLRSVGAGFETVPAGELGTVEAVGAQPGTGSAWVAGEKEGSVLLRSVSASGAVGPGITLPQPAEELDPKGAPTKVVCPAVGQCWLSTANGWLFHLGGSLEQDADPAMHVLITQRPADGSTRSFVPGGVPIDNSGEVESRRVPGEGTHEPFPHERRARKLVTKVKQKVIHRTVLQLSFFLHAKAHVQLLAERHHKVVAKTDKLTLGKGPHRLRLHLDPDRWPTGLDFEVHPAGGSK